MRTTANIRINLILPESLGNIFVADSIGLSSFKFSSLAVAACKREARCAAQPDLDDLGICLISGESVEDQILSNWGALVDGVPESRVPPVAKGAVSSGRIIIINNDYYYEDYYRAMHVVVARYCYRKS